VIVDLDGVLVIAHSDKQDAAEVWKRTLGHQPILGFRRPRFGRAVHHIRTDSPPGDATVGPPVFPHPARYSETARQKNRRTVVQDRG